MNAGYFTREFLESLPPDPAEALVLLGEEYKRLRKILPDDADVREVLALLRAFLRAHAIDTKELGPEPIDVDDPAVAHQRLARLFAKFRVDHAKKNLKSLEDGYLVIFEKGTNYEFSDEDLAKIQALISELRGLITKSVLISEDHRRRLLRRLEAMQQELNKRTSDIDRFWGFLAEAGIVARKFGEDLEPITDRVEAIAKIVIAVIFATEGVEALPAVSKLLLPKSQQSEAQGETIDVE